MNKNTGLVKSNSMFSKMRRFLNNIFKKKDKSVSTIETEIKPAVQNTSTELINSLKKSIIGEEENKTRDLAVLLKTKKITIEELSYSEKIELISYFKSEIERKTEILDNMKNKILYKMLKQSSNPTSVLEKVPTEQKENFIKYMKSQIEAKHQELDNINSRIAKKQSGNPA